MAVLEETCVGADQGNYYDPTTAQFTTPDPLYAITGERYGYAGNDPINGSDPTGLFCVVHNSSGGCLGSGVVHNAASYASSWVPNCVTIGNSNCTSLGDSHPVARDTLYVTAGAAATVASGGLALDAVGLSSAGVDGAAFSGMLGTTVEGVGSVGAGAAAAYGDYGRCVHGGDTLACAGLASGGLAALLGVPALFPELAPLGLVGLPFAFGGLGVDEYSLYRELYDRLAGCS